MSEQITRSIIVKADASQAFSAWANFENFPRFMRNVKKVEVKDSKVSHWEVEGPLGKTVEWDAEVTRLDLNKRIAWNTKDRDGGDITTSGQVTFNELPDHQTEVTMVMQYDVQGAVNKIGEKLFANPEKQAEQDLVDFKAFVEGMHDRTAAA